MSLARVQFFSVSLDGFGTGEGGEVTRRCKGIGRRSAS
jgi:hypothetical protein